MSFSEESEKNLRYWDLKQRLYIALQRGWPGMSGPEIIPELESIVRELQSLLPEGLPSSVTPKDVTHELAGAEFQIALMYSWAGDLLRSEAHYEQAARFYDESGRASMAEHCRKSIQDNRLRQSGDFDHKLQELLRLESIPSRPLDRCRLFLDLSELYLSIGDAFEAERRLSLVESEMAKAGFQAPTAEELTQGFRGSLGWGDVEEMQAGFARYHHLAAVHDTFKRLYLSLAYVYRKKDPAAAQAYTRRHQELVDRELTQEALAQELEAVQSRRLEEQSSFQAGLPDLVRPGGVKPLLDEIRSLVGEERFQECFGENPEKKHDEIEAVRQRIDESWRARQEENPFQIKIDVERMREKGALLAIGSASSGDPLQEVEDQIRTAREAGNPESLVRSLLRKGEILATGERDEESLATLAEARAALGDVAHHDLGVYVLGLMAEIHARRGEWRTVVEICQQGIETVEAYRFRVSEPYLQSAYLMSRVKLYRLGVRSACELEQWERALLWADLSKSRAILGYSQLSSMESEDPEELQEAFWKICEKIDSAARIGGVPTELMEEKRIVGSLLFLQRARGKIPAGLSELNLRSIQEGLDPDEAILYYYWIDRERLLLATIDHERLRLETREVSAEQREDLEELRLARASWVPASDVGHAPHRDLKGSTLPNPKTLTKIVQGLSELLLPSSESLRDRQRLLVSPHSILHGVPFHSLSWQGDVLLRSFAVTYVPNLASLAFRFVPSEKQRVLLVGARDFHGLPPLEMAEREVRELKELYEGAGVPVTPLIGEDATKSEIRQLERTGDLSDFTCLHFATHGSSTPEDFPLESQLFFRDAALEGTEIITWRLEAELVVLSACWSGERPVAGRGMEELPGDEMFGLQAAFFAAGARCILGALWPTKDQTSYEVTTRFHRQLLEGHPPETALRLALLSLLDEPETGRGPLDWAPFFIVALGRQKRREIEATESP